MLGKEIFVGYSKISVNENNTLTMPTFARANAGDRYVLIPENNDIAIYSMSTIKSYYDKVESLPTKDRLYFAKEMRKMCDTIIEDIVVDDNHQIHLSSDINVVNNIVEFVGSGDRVLMSGEFEFNNELTRNKKQA